MGNLCQSMLLLFVLLTFPSFCIDVLTLQKRYMRPALPCDLNRGMESYKDEDDSGGDLSLIAQSLVEANFDPVKEHVQVITYRNNLNKILGSLYQREPWTISITLRDSILYFDIRKSDNGSFPDQSKFCYYGYKFESCCILPTRVHDNIANLEDFPAMPSEQYCAVFLTKLEGFRMVIAAEIDCADHKGNMVEIKTNRIISNDRQKRTFERHKLLKFWIQSYIVNVPKIIVGFRDDDGIVHSIEELHTHQIPQRCKDLWNADRCLVLLSEVLKFVHQQNLEENREYLLEFNHPFTKFVLREAAS